jgi:hypothetical protein
MNASEIIDLFIKDFEQQKTESYEKNLKLQGAVEGLTLVKQQLSQQEPQDGPEPAAAEQGAEVSSTPRSKRSKRK